MRAPVYIFLLVAFVFFSCKRQRRIDVSGIVTDRNTGEVLPNVKVTLISTIGDEGKYPEDRKYERMTNSEGRYLFESAFFKKPSFYGEVFVSEPNYLKSIQDREYIDSDDAKWLGKTKLKLNLSAVCMAKLNMSLNMNPIYNNKKVNYFLKFIGSKPLGLTDNYSTTGSELPSSIVAYSDGYTLLKTEIKDVWGTLIKTQFDTIISKGCGSVNEYTLTID